MQYINESKLKRDQTPREQNFRSIITFEKLWHLLHFQNNIVTWVYEKDLISNDTSDMKDSHKSNQMLQEL